MSSPPYDQEFLNKLSDGFVAIDKDWTILQVNKTEEELTGLKSEEQVGHSLLDLFFSTPETQNLKALNFYKQVMREKVSVNFIDYYAPLDVWVNVEAYPSPTGGVEIFFKDISKTRETEKKLIESEGMYEKYAEAMPQMAFIADAEGRMLYYNSRHYEYFGLEKNDEEGWRWVEQDIHHPDDLERTVASWNYSLQNFVEYNIEYRLRRHDGEFRWHLGRAVPIKNSQGEVTKWFGTNTDIHDAKVKEKELLRQKKELENKEAQYRGIFEAASDAFMIFGEDGKLIEGNPACFKMHGYEREEMIGMTGEDFVHPKDLSEFDRFVQDIREGKGFSVSARHLHKNGEPIFVEVVGSPILFKGENHLLAVVRNVTDREIALDKERKIEEDLKRREAEMRALANSIPQLAWMADASGWIYWYNDRWYDYTGTKLEEMKGWGWEKVHHPEHIERVVSFVKKAWSSPVPWELTFPLKGADGQYRWFLTRAVPIFDDQGNITRWFGTNTDIHEEKLNAQKLEVTSAELEKAVASRDEFLSIASHELKTPLTALVLQLEILGLQLDSNEPLSELKETVLVTEQQVDRLDKLVADLLDITRIRSGATRPNCEVFMLDELIKNVTRNYAESIKQANCHLELNLNEGIEVRWDRAQIEQVLTNLVSNAIKYAAGEKITIKTSNEGAKALVEVIDTGPGISAKKQEIIFERFKRATSSRKTSGLGLGLFICRQIVESHGGVLNVKSELGKGANFSLLIPRRF